MIGVVATLTVAEGKEAEFEQVFAEMAAGVHANEPGNKLYQLVRNKKNPQEYAVMELYEDEAALETHREQAHYKDAQPKLGPCLAGKPDIKFFDTVG
jgi:quinol monooxygenase YgiN